MADTYDSYFQQQAAPAPTAAPAIDSSGPQILEPSQPAQPQVAAAAPAPPTSAAVSADYDTFFQGAGRAQKAQAQSSFYLAQDTDPDHAGKVLNLSAETGVAPDFVSRNLEPMARDQQFGAIDIPKLSRLNPAIMRLANDPLKAAAIKDDLPGLRKAEDRVVEHGMFENAGNILAAAVLDMAAGATKIPALDYDLINYPGNLMRSMTGDPRRVTSDATPFGRNNPVTKYLTDKANEFRRNAPILEENPLEAFGKTIQSKPDASIPERAMDAITQGDYARGAQVLVAHGVSQAPMILALFGGAAVGVGPIATALLGAQTAADKNAANLEAGVDPARGIPNAAAHGAIVTYMDRFGAFDYFAGIGSRLTQKFGPQVATQVMRSYGGQILQTMGLEAVKMGEMSLAGDYADFATGVNKDAFVGSLARAANASLLGGLIGGATTAPVEGFVRLQEIRRANAAKNLVQNLTADSAGKTRDRAPELHSEFVRNTVEGTPYAEAQIAPEALETFFQKKGEDPIKAMQDLGFLDRFAHAKDTGTRVRIPTEELVDKIQKTGHQDLADHVTFHEEDASVADLELRRQTEEDVAKANRESLDQAESVALNERGLTPEQQRAESATKVREHIEGQLEAAGRDKREAEIVSKSIETLAARANLDPLELFNRINLSISGPDSALEVPSNARQLEQSAADTEAIARAKEVLNRVDTVEKATSLRGEERQEYLDALDTMYGDRDTRLQMLMEGRDDLSSPEQMFAKEELVDTGAGHGAAIDKYLEPGHVFRREQISPEDVQRGGSRIETYDKPLFLEGEEDEAYANQYAKDLKGDTAQPISVRPNDGEGRPYIVESGRHRTRAAYLRGDKTLAADILHRTPDAAFDPRFKDSPRLLAQGGDETPRGLITIAPDRINIQLLEGANRSTFQHEVGHFIVEMMKRLSPESEQIKTDFETLMKHVGNDGGEISVKQHEEIARSFEAYLMEGKAPSSELRKAFVRMKTWMVDVYRHIRALDVNLSDDVRAVFDRVLATDEEIAEARAGQNFESLFSNPARQQLSPEQYAKIGFAVDAAKAAAEDHLRAEVMEDIRKEETETWNNDLEKERVKARAEAEQMDVFKAISLLQRGETPAGEKLPPELQGIKINRQALVDMFGKDILEKLPKPLVYSKEGLHPDAVADMLGYESGKAMVEELTTFPKMRDYVEEVAQAEMQKKSPDLYKSSRMVDEAMKAIHNNEQAKVMRLEMDYLREMSAGAERDLTRMISKRPPPDRVLKETVRAELGRMKFDDVRPNAYRVAERQAAKAAGEALAKGDIDGAYEAKRKELLNHELFRAATEAREDVDKSMKFFKRLNRTDEDLAKSRDTNLVNTARAILAMNGIGKSDQAPKFYLEKMRSYDPDGYDAAAYHVANATNQITMNYRENTMGAFREMTDSVRALWELSRDAKTLEIEGKRVRKEEIVTDLITQLGNTGDLSKVTPGLKRAVTKAENIKLNLLSWRAALTRVEHWVHGKDLSDLGGVFTKHIWEPIQAATTTKALKYAEMMETYKAHVDKFREIFDTKPIEAAEIDYTFANKKELLGAMMHTGNDSNLSKLLRGRSWGEINEDGSLNRSRWDSFMERMHREGVLTKADYDFVQGVWDMYESIKPDAQKAHKKMFGYHFNEVTADAFQTPFGEYKGGYAPAVADPNIVNEAAMRREAEAFGNHGNMMLMPTGGRGFTKNRVEGYAAPLALDLDYVPMAVDKVLRFTYVEGAARDVAKLVYDRKFVDAIHAVDPGAHEMLVGWLNRAAKQSAGIPSGQGRGWRALDQFFRAVRTRTGLGAMAGNVVNAFHQLTGLSVVMSMVKPSHVRDALINYVTDGKGVTENIMEKSEWMRSHHADPHALQGEIEDIMINPGKIKTAEEWAKKNAYFLQRFTAGFTESVAWSGAYSQAIERGVAEKEAILFADSAVRRTQHAMAPTDVASYETGAPLYKMFTQFTGYYNNKANLLGSKAMASIRELGIKKAAIPLLGLYVTVQMIPAIMAKTAYRAAEGKLDENDDGHYLDDVTNLFFHSQIDEALALIPFVGPTVNHLIKTGSSDRPRDERFVMAPGFTLIEKLGMVYPHTRDAIKGKGKPSAAIKDWMTLIGMMTGAPVQPLAKPIGYAADVQAGKVKARGALDYSRGLVTGYGPRH